jgi:hypothetical protein
LGLAGTWGIVKDREFVAVLLAEAMIDPDVLRERVASLQIPPEAAARLDAWLNRFVAEL